MSTPNDDPDASEILRAAGEIGVQCVRLPREDAVEFISRVRAAFAPRRTTGHLAIGDGSDAYPLEGVEFDYARLLPEGPARVIFGANERGESAVVELADGRQLCRALEECYGIEYFASDRDCTFLVAVNWYVVEVAGTLRQRFQREYSS